MIAIIAKSTINEPMCFPPLLVYIIFKALLGKNQLKMLFGIGFLFLIFDFSSRVDNGQIVAVDNFIIIFVSQNLADL